MALIGEMHYLTIGGNTYSIPTSGGSTVSVTRALTSGTKTATISVDGTSYDLYAPTPNAGTITSVKTTAGAHTAINISSGAAEFNVPTKTSHLTNDSGFITNYTETDPIFSASPAAGITAADITNWNGKSSTDEKVKAIALPTTSSTYYLVLGSNSGTAETKNYSDKLAFEYSSSQVVLKVGDTTSNQKGRIYLYGPSTGGVTYLDTAATISRSITLPDKTGTIALISDIPTYTDTNTWRPVQLNGTQILAGTTGTNALNLKAGTNVSLSNSSGTVTINGPDLSGYAQSSAIPTKTSDLTNDSGFLTSSDIASVMKYKGTKATVSALPTSGNTTGDVWHVTADGSEWAWDGSTWQELGTAIDLSGYALSSAIPTKTSQLTNDNGFITSYTDTKVTQTVDNTTNSKLSMVFSPSNSTATEELKKTSKLTWSPTTSTLTVADKTIGSSGISKVEINPTGVSLYNSNNYFARIALTSDRTSSGTIYLPNKDGTIALTSDISVPTFVVTLTLEDSELDTYSTDKTAKEIYDAHNSGKVVLLKYGSYILLGDTWAEESNNYYQATFYEHEATTTTTNGYTIITSNNNTSVNHSTYNPTAVTLNGISTNNANFYAPTSAGTNGQYLKSNGSGAPSWVNFPTIPTKTSDLTNDSGFITDADIPEGASAYTGTISAVGTTAASGTSNAFARGDHVHNITGATVKSALGTGSGTTKFLREDGTWATPAYIANTDYHVKQAPINDDNAKMLLLSDHTPANNTEHDGTSYTSKYLYFSPSTGSLTLATSNSIQAEIGPTYVRLMGQNTSVYTVTLKTPEISGAKTFIQTILPDKDGTIALTSDIPSIPTSTESSTTGITASTTATKTTLGTAFTIPNVTSAGSASTWTFGATTVGDGTLVGAVDSSDTSMLVITAGTKSIQQKTGGANGSAPTLGTAFTVPNVTGNTSATVSITDNGHTHTI